MADTFAVPLEHLARANCSQAGQPLCPACVGGRLHPYYVTFALGGFQGVDSLSGWIAVCVGNADHNRQNFGESHGQAVASPCGFSMPMTPHRPLG